MRKSTERKSLGPHPQAGHQLSEVDLDVAPQAGAVEVLGVNRAALEAQRIGGTGQSRRPARPASQGEGPRCVSGAVTLTPLPPPLMNAVTASANAVGDSGGTSMVR